MPPRKGEAEGRDGGSGDDERLSLPPEIWAHVLECLPYESILSCSATCRSFLHEALPALRKLRIDKSSEMNLKVASRFRDITEIQINSLLTQRYDDDGDKETKVDLETSLRIVPFLSRFPHLERVSFGGKNEGGTDMAKFSPADGYFYADDDDGDGGDRGKMLTVLDNISAAFRVGALPNDLQISGIVCPRAYHGSRPPECATCMKACRSFPLETVVHFESRGSSRNQAKSGRSWPVDVCLQRSQMEFITETRPGGNELLSSKERLLRLLGRGRRRTMSHDGKSFHLVNYDEGEIEEMERVIQYAKIDTEKLSQAEVVGAVMRSFAQNDAGPIPPRNQCYLSDGSFDALKNQLEISVEKNSINAPIEDMIRTLPLIARIVMRTHELEHDDEEGSVDVFETGFENDCLRLIRRLLEMDTPPIEEVIALGLVPDLLSRIGPYLEDCKDPAIALHIILSKGTEEQRKAIVESDTAVDRFSRCLTSSDATVLECAVSALIHLAKVGANKQVEEMEKKLVVTKMVSLLSTQQKHDVIVADTLRFLCIATKKSTGAPMLAVACKSLLEEANKAGLLAHLATTMASSSKEACVLANCSVLLRRIFDEESNTSVVARIEEAIQLELVPMVTDLLIAKQDDAVQMNLSHVMMHLVSGTNDQTKRLLAQQDEIIAVLAGLFGSPNNSVAEKAMLKVGAIASGIPERRDQMMLDATIVDALLLSIKRSYKLEIHRAATKTLMTMCCEGQPPPVKFATRTLDALLPLLENDDSIVAEFACQVLSYLLGGFKAAVAETPTDGNVQRTLTRPDMGLNNPDDDDDGSSESSASLDSLGGDDEDEASNETTAPAVTAAAFVARLAPSTFTFEGSPLKTTSPPNAEGTTVSDGTGVGTASEPAFGMVAFGGVAPQKPSTSSASTTGFGSGPVFGSAPAFQGGFASLASSAADQVDVVSDAKKPEGEEGEPESSDTEDVVKAIIKPAFVAPILKRLLDSSINVEALEPAMKSIHLISTMGDAGIQSLTISDGLAAMKELLGGPHGLHELLHKPACNTVANIIAGDEAKIQKFIDLGLAKCFAKMTTDSLFRVKKQALWVLYLAAKGGTSSQIEQMVAQGGIHEAFCSMLSEETNMSVVALWSLQIILKVGKASSGDAISTADIETKLKELMDETTRLESETERIGLLEKKRDWAFYDQQHQYVESLTDTCAFLEEQSRELQEKLQSFEDNIAAKRPLKKFCNKVTEKHNELKKIISGQKNDLQYDLKQAQSKLDLFEEDAEKNAPKEEWGDRLNQFDMPTDLAGVKKALDASKSNVKAIESTRRSAQRQKDIDALKTALGGLFKRGEDGGDSANTPPEESSLDDVASKKRKRLDSLDAAEGRVSSEVPAETRTNENGNKAESSTKPKKKKKQRSIATFFGKAATDEK